MKVVKNGMGRQIINHKIILWFPIGMSAHRQSLVVQREARIFLLFIARFEEKYFGVKRG
jgi:hypothetical protein